MILLDGREEKPWCEPYCRSDKGLFKEFSVPWVCISCLCPTSAATAGTAYERHCEGVTY